MAGREGVLSPLPILPCVYSNDSGTFDVWLTYIPSYNRAEMWHNNNYVILKNTRTNFVNFYYHF